MTYVLGRQNQARVIRHTGFFFWALPFASGQFSDLQFTITSLPLTLREPIRV
jgi:hypothetical protein